MTEKQIESIIKFHKMACKLKTTVRTGWKYWKVDEKRLESVAEHVFGCCMLAVGIYSSVQIDIKIEKVITMLALHETEEMLIGDITMFDTQKLKTKKQDGRKAVLSLFKDFDNADKFLDLIEEFENCSTKEANFAHQIDKLEADLQAEYYSNSVNYKEAKELIMSNPVTIQLKELGCKTLGEYFLQSDMHKFDGECLEIAKYIENKKIL